MAFPFFSAFKDPAKSPSFAIPVDLKHPGLLHCCSEVSSAQRGKEQK